MMTGIATTISVHCSQLVLNPSLTMIQKSAIDTHIQSICIQFLTHAEISSRACV